MKRAQDAEHSFPSNSGGFGTDIANRGDRDEDERKLAALPENAMWAGGDEVHSCAVPETEMGTLATAPPRHRPCSEGEVAWLLELVAG